MPSVVGFVNIVNVGSGSIVHFGDALQISPNSTSKTFAGAGSFLTGSLANSNSAVSATNSIDPDVQDSSNNKVAAGAGNIV
ncbi:spore gernimation protein GerPA [Paenibacillus sp. 32O-W]|jgi:spore germination protein PA/spore germination protein PF|uniref:Germination protein GerPA n=1 Tax=Paenibacillus cisolokensis TaxID=1658519 RepID=A0ABQ4N186_9BACL|nr:MULTISPECIES: spore germination protein [Paenibacillus]ALS28451.1 spore gernimation protein GerPA [Paenibacillus sp. 32O-W]GIQ61941.1 germination protein GerPA [Paenibacillus cisolokensis]